MSAAWDAHLRANRREEAAFWSAVAWYASLYDWTPPPPLEGWGPLELSASRIGGDSIMLHGMTRRIGGGGFVSAGCDHAIAHAVWAFSLDSAGADPKHLALAIWDAVDSLYRRTSEAQGRWKP